MFDETNKPMTESEFSSRVLQNPLATSLKINVYKTDGGYQIQYTKLSESGQEIRYLVNSRGKTKYYKSLDTIYKNVVEKYGCPVNIEPSFKLS